MPNSTLSLVAVVVAASLGGCTNTPADLDEVEFWPEGAEEPNWALPPPPAPTCAPGTAAEVGGARYPDLQSALDAAASNQTVWVCPGTHLGPFHTWGGAPRGTAIVRGSTGDPADVTIDPMGGDGIELFGRALAVMDISFASANQPTGDGVAASAIGGALAVRGCRFFGLGDLTTQARAVDAVDQARFVMRDSEISNVTGFAVHINAGLFDTQASIIDTSIVQTTGPALTYIDSMHPTDGGHLLVERTVIDGTFIDPAQGADLAAVYAVSAGPTTAIFRDVDFTNNVGGWSSAVHWTKTAGPNETVVFDGAIITDNTSTLKGAVTFDMHTTSRGAIDVDFTDSALLRNRIDPLPAHFSFASAVTLYSRVRARFTNVDLGAGPDNNLGGWDLGPRCQSDYGAGVTGVYVSGVRCP